MPTLSKSRVAVLLGFAGGLLLLWPGKNFAAENDSVLRDTLSNGMRVVIVRDRLAPVVATVLNYRVGSDEAPEGFPGMAHAQEHMMFRGSPDLSSGQLAEIAAAMGGDFNADTQQSVTQYFFTVPSEDVTLPLHVEALRMRGVLDSDSLWNAEKPAIEQEVAQDLSDPQYVFYAHLLESLFKGTPYAHDALGTVESFDKTTGEMLQQFHSAWYAPNNAILIVVGDVQPQQTLSDIKRLFDPIPSKKLPARPEVRLQPVMPETFKLRTDLPYGLAVTAFRMPGLDSPDYGAAQVLSDVLNSERSQLYSLVPSGKALSTSFSMESLPKAGLGYAVAAFPKAEDGMALENQVRDVLSAYLKNGFPADLVESAKRQEVTAAELQRNSVAGLAMAWAQAVAIEGRTSPDDDLHAIQRVTAGDVNRVARKYFNLDDDVVAFLTPEASGAPVSSAQPGARESLASKEASGAVVPDWAAQTLSKLSIPPSSVKPTLTTLPNGIKLIVQPETVSHTVSVYGHIENNQDLETPAGQEGVADLLDQLLAYGTTKLDRVAFQKALDGIGAQESAGSDFSLQVLTSQFDPGTELLADNELRPALPEQAFATVRQQVAATVAGRLDSPDYLTGRAVDKLLFPQGDPALRQATPQTVSSLSLEDVRGYYHKTFRPDLTTIVVIGEITPAKASSVIEKYFGEWKASGPKPPTILPPVPPNKMASTEVPDSSRVQDRVTLAETVDLVRLNPDYYALELGNHVLGGGFYATRLYRDLRENGGFVYTVSSTFDVGKSRGIYAVRYGCNPENVYQAESLVQRDLQEMQMTPASPRELQQAKAMLLREMPLAESSVDRIASALLYRSREDLPLDEPARAAHIYLDLTAEQVRAAFAKWLRASNLVLVTEGPPPRL